VVSLRQRDGSEVWHNDRLKRRGLSTPAVTSTAIAVADYQGYLHWLDKRTGVLVARQRVAKFRVSNPPIAVKDTVVVLTDSGRLAAYRATPRVAPAAAEAPPAAAQPLIEPAPVAPAPLEAPPAAEPTPAPTPQ
jgi:outer membrane protein assembly factor BamB